MKMTGSKQMNLLEYSEEGSAKLGNTNLDLLLKSQDTSQNLNDRIINETVSNDDVGEKAKP